MSRLKLNFRILSFLLITFLKQRYTPIKKLPTLILRETPNYVRCAGANFFKISQSIVIDDSRLLVFFAKLCKVQVNNYCIKTTRLLILVIRFYFKNLQKNTTNFYEYLNTQEFICVWLRHFITLLLCLFSFVCYFLGSFS